MERRVVVPVGGTDREFVVQEQAMALARALRVPVVGLHISTEDEPPDVFGFLTVLSRRHEVPLETRFISGPDVADELANETTGVDVIVIGTRRLGDQYEESITQKLIQQADASVYVVRLE